MKTVRDIGNLALKKLGVLRAGAAASAVDMADAADSLQSQYMEWITQGTFGRVFNVTMGREGAVSPQRSAHINVTTEDEVSIEIPATVEWDYWGSCEPCGDYGWPLPNTYYGGSGVVPRDKSVVMVTDQFGPARPVYVFDGTVQRWMRVDTLALNDEAPLSARGTDGLAAVLAVRLADEYGANLLSPATVLAGNRYKLALVTHYGSEEYC